MTSESLDASGTHVQRTQKGWSASDVPWQIWVVVALQAMSWIYTVVEFRGDALLGTIMLLPLVIAVIIGLLRGWRWAFVFEIVADTFSTVFSVKGEPFQAFLGLVGVILTASAIRYYFPKRDEGTSGQ